MKLTSIWVALLTAGVCGVAPTEALQTTSKHPSGDDVPTLFRNFNGWVNPEDLIPMPQCIAQQNYSTWLSTMTKCTHKRCTSHFGIICTHHQWLTQLSCLSTEFSSDVVKEYLPYCSRSILSKAQLYRWIHSATGRTWLVDVGDANELHNLSPASLGKGYAAMSVTYKAPACLTDSLSSPSKEPFQHVMGSCSFAGTSQRTGNAGRPWEYSESLRSMVSLGLETVGYNLTGGIIGQGEYFDQDCFCNIFTTDPKREPCSEPGQLDLTKERLWLNATCGPTSLPANWTDALKIMGFAYILTQDWHWPSCIADIPEQVTELVGQCTTNICEVDSDGYCQVKLAIDRSCFCRDLSYDSCRGSCHFFETRIDYVEWLHNLCGNVQDWHGLPDNWRQLAAPIPLDMIPWSWTVKPSNYSNSGADPGLGSSKAMEECGSNEWKLGSFALINVATFLTAFLGQGKGISQLARDSRWHPSGWFRKGLFIATLQLLANFINGFLVQTTFGYEDVPVFELMLLWCSMPRLGWLTILPIGFQPFEMIDFSAALSPLFAEVILQFLSSYAMVLTINYGREHDFYFRNLENVERGQSAKLMYFGALLWLIVIAVACVHLFQAMYRANTLAISGRDDLPKWQRSTQTSNIVEELGAQQREYSARFEENFVSYWVGERRPLRETSPTGNGVTTYGTVPIESKDRPVPRTAFAKLYVVTVISMFLLWVAQWLFWAGFIGLSSEEFCPPKLWFLTVVWITSSFASVAIRAT